MDMAITSTSPSLIVNCTGWEVAIANKTRTTRIKGDTEYAKVADRPNKFRKANPRSKIFVKHYHDEEGNLTSRAYI